MMKAKLNIIKGLGILAIVVAAFTSNAQQDPMFTQYMFNTQTINPAYAGTWESVGFMALGRHQWTGWDGAPTTYTFSVQAPLKNERVALGLNVMNDKVGLEKRFYVFADYSYLVPLSEKTSLRLGLKGGFTNYSNNLAEYTILDPGDPNFAGEIKNAFKPNFGVGAFLYSKRAYVGLSVPKLVSTTFENDMESFSVEGELRHYFLIAGAVFDMGENVKFKPTMFTKASFTSETGTPLQFDLTGNFLIKEKFWLGAMYRTGSSYGFIAQWIFDQKLRVGYAIDFATSNVKHYNNGTHEVMISYELRFKKEEVVSPRYF
ncbi:type IX secretion system membrane protein PorP/SprF [uncultured Draconibacterium sp.]|uniref:PorP/SprF family type IX secretion system membrane protein n=1 Tax=uncultured Draconibacterium sp. TaxID=1573823 RepID=UPI0029C6EA41|nr:type IX secretion system membrane protein PorP/SprF [uncultured Draconibacterium sp.]